MEDKQGLVSIIIPTYNRKHTLKRCMDSVLNQTYHNYEIIMIDDCSTDGTLEFLSREYGELIGESVVYIRNEANMGASASRNEGLAHANGEYIAFQDSDTWWMPDKLEKQVNYMNSLEDSAAMVYSPYQRIYHDYSIIYPSMDVALAEKSGYILPFLLEHPLVDTPTMLIRKEVLKEMGGFDIKMKALEDYELSIRIAQKYQIAIIDEVLLVSYDEKDSISNDTAGYIRNSFYLLEKYRGLFEKYNKTMAYLNQLSLYAMQYQQLELYMKCMKDLFGIEI